MLPTEIHNIKKKVIEKFWDNQCIIKIKDFFCSQAILDQQKVTNKPKKILKNF